MKSTKKVTLILLFVSLFFSIASSQTKQELQKRKQNTEKELRLTNQLLEQTEKSRSAGLNKLLIIKKRISLREQLINEISQQINLLDKRIDQKTERIKGLEKELKQLKEEYAKMIYFAYKNSNNHDRLMFILAAEDFNQAYRRMKYFQQYTKYREKQAQKIVVTQKNLQYETEQLKEQRKEKIELLSSKERERTNLNSEKYKERAEVTRLKRKEAQLQNKIEDQQRIMKQLENAIAELIAREAKGNNTFKTLTANEEIISQGFKNEKGKLSWPIENGVVLREFGEHPHPVIRGVKIKNEGIDIGATEDAKVKSIYDGQIKKVIAVPGANMAVIIRHGHYLTLYSNLVNVRVKTGDQVTKGYHIGDVYYTKEEKSAVVHIRIYEETNVLNPKNWLSGM